MSKQVLKALPELLKEGILQPETAAKIREYYQEKTKTSDNRLFTIFGVFGALLIGLGIILIVAHNWDNFSRTLKTCFAFLPLLIGQGFAAITLLKKPESAAWRESSATFLFFAIATAISLVSQIYHIPGNISSFILTWMLLSLPLVYLLRSSMISLFYIIGLTYYGCEIGYWSSKPKVPIYYWLLLLPVLPYYLDLIRKDSKSNFMSFHHWIIPLSVIICLGTVGVKNEEWLFPAYFCLLGVLYLIGNLTYFSDQHRINNGYLIIGSLGMVGLLLFSSFDWLWKELSEESANLFEPGFWSSPEFITLLVLLFSGLFLLYWLRRKDNWSDFNPMEVLFIPFTLFFLLGLFYPIWTTILINLITLLIGIYYIRRGGQLDHLIILNYGLLIITALIICRFFDTNLSFITRGLLFVGVGAGFFYANYNMLKRRGEN